MARRQRLYCAFCRRDDRTVDKLVGGPGVCICDACVAACVDVLDGNPTAGFAGWASLDDDALLASLVPAGACARSLEASIGDIVTELRRRQVTWERIGEGLGVTRQAAQQRFGR